MDLALNTKLIEWIVSNMLQAAHRAVASGWKAIFILDFDGTSSLYEEWYSPDNRIYPFLRDFLNQFARAFPDFVEIWVVSNKPLEQILRLSGLTGVRFVGTEALLYAHDNAYLVPAVEITQLIQYNAPALAEEVMRWQANVIGCGTQVGERLFYHGSWELKFGLDNRLIGCCFHGKQQVEEMAMRHLFYLGQKYQTGLLNVTKGADVVSVAPRVATKVLAFDKMQAAYGPQFTKNCYIIAEDSETTQERLLQNLAERGATQVYGLHVVNNGKLSIDSKSAFFLRVAPVHTAQNLLEVLNRFPDVITRAREGK